MFEIPPYVERQASIDRAFNEIKAFKKRRDQVKHLVDASGEDGMTWKELSNLLDLHHGQVSAVLSKLHDDGILIALTKIRNGSHPYISARLASMFNEEELTRRPARTKARRYLDLRHASGELIRLLDSGSMLSEKQIDAIEKVRLILDDLGE